MNRNKNNMDPQIVKGWTQICKALEFFEHEISKRTNSRSLPVRLTSYISSDDDDDDQDDDDDDDDDDDHVDDDEHDDNDEHDEHDEQEEQEEHEEHDEHDENDEHDEHDNDEHEERILNIQITVCMKWSDNYITRQLPPSLAVADVAKIIASCYISKQSLTRRAVELSQLFYEQSM